MNKLKHILNRPFPVVETSQEKFMTASLFGGFVFIFLLLFEPFGMDQVEANKILYNLGYGIITASVILFHGFVTMKIFPNFFESENWVVWKSLIHNSIIILPIALLNWIYFDNVYKPQDISYSFVSFLFITIGVGLLPSPILILYFERRLSAKNHKLSDKMNKQLAQNKLLEEKKETIELESEGITFSADDFLCAKSMSNYITIHYLKNGREKKTVIRETMKNFEIKISVSPENQRCHRSYFVNTGKIIETIGNARSLYLRIEHLDFEIPVSRSFSKKLIEEIG